MPFPPFSDYQDVFSLLLSASTFAAFAVPAWMPSPVRLLCLAKAIYLHWRERRTERGGHRIIPTLNVSPLWFSSSDTSDNLAYNHFYSSTRWTPTTGCTYASVTERSSPPGRLASLKPLLPTNYPVCKWSLHRPMAWPNHYSSAKT